MGMLHANRVQKKVRYFIHYSHGDIELDYDDVIVGLQFTVRSLKTKN